MNDRDVRAAQNLSENLAWKVNMLTDLIRGHDAIHPDRNDCGGVGGCLMMRAEHDGETEVREMLDTLARRGLRIAVTAHPADAVTTTGKPR